MSRLSLEQSSREPIARRTRLSKSNRIPRADARLQLPQNQNILLSNRFDALDIQTSELSDLDCINDAPSENLGGSHLATRQTTERRITRSMSQQLSNFTGASAPTSSSGASVPRSSSFGASAPRSSRMEKTASTKRRTAATHVSQFQRRPRLRRDTFQNNQDTIIDGTLSNNTETLLNSRGENFRMERRSAASVGHSEVPGMGAPGPAAPHPRFEESGSEEAELGQV